MNLISDIKITWNPGGVVLLDFGDEIGDELAPGMSQMVSEFAAIGLAWGSGSADGGARRDVSFSRIVTTHANRAAVLNYCMLYPAQLANLGPGELTVEVQGGATILMESAAIQACNPQPLLVPPNSSLTQFRISAHKTRPISGYPVAAGVPLGWWTEAFGDIGAAFGDL